MAIVKGLGRFESTTPGTAVQITSSAEYKDVYSWTIQADPDNDDIVYLGDATLDVTDPDVLTGCFYVLQPGQSMPASTLGLNAVNLTKIWYDPKVSGDGIIVGAIIQ